MKIEDYPLAKELIFDAEGNISQVILNYTDYQYLLEAIEDRGLLIAMGEVKDEKPLTLQQALRELEQE
ncbi:MAG: hypothetical protein HC849_18820 [Oscillatoriales cyanobacterium RU_3_3]|nr:hypothetical protein [Microcoleus sp. SU_5_6]NJL68861.1 hypothetical protein [Microcoleus sp. SM1_3_4]NJM61784.1 hypothetical protein [Oscillatoriales cyanobacterium RU_3_3]NJR26547.1 hypothetical protein [Richelia sp. CSU_2_1]